MTPSLMIGTQFGSLLVVAGPVRVPNGRKLTRIGWVCQCVCGNRISTAERRLVEGRAASCGCQRDALISIARSANPPKPRHGHSHSPTYRTWYAMKQRCGNPNNVRWQQYGGRGIRVCERWLMFDNFLADMGVRPDGKTIDRINVDGDYERSNCRWASPQEQRHNRTDSRRVQ